MFWILGRVFRFCDVFWILGRVFGFWEVFWILGRVLDSGKCFVPTSHRKNTINDGDSPEVSSPDFFLREGGRLYTG